MQKKFATIHDYHNQDRAIRVDGAEYPAVRVLKLDEGSGDVRFIRTDRHALVMTLDGTAKHLTRMDGINSEEPSRPDDICLIPGGMPLHLAWTNHAAVQRSLMVEFDETFFQTYVPEVATEAFRRGHLLPANFAQRPVMGNLIRLLSREITPETSQGRLFADTAIRLLALEVAASAWTVPAFLNEARSRPDARLKRAIDYIEAFFTTDISILDIAAAAGLSQTQLTRSFRLATGKTPYSYVIDRRLDHAVGLLRSTELPIAFIALEAGFTDQAHFTRLCRSRLGKTPGTIRRG